MSLSLEPPSCPACGTPLAAFPQACPRCSAAARPGPLADAHLRTLQRPGPGASGSRVPLRVLTPALAGHIPLARHVLGARAGSSRSEPVHGHEADRIRRGHLHLVHSRGEDTLQRKEGAHMHTDDERQAPAPHVPQLEELDALGPARPRGSAWVGLAVATLLLLGTGVWMLLRGQGTAQGPVPAATHAAPETGTPRIVPAAGHGGAPGVAPASLPQTRPALPDTEDGT